MLGPDTGFMDRCGHRTREQKGTEGKQGGYGRRHGAHREDVEGDKGGCGRGQGVHRNTN